MTDKEESKAEAVTEVSGVLGTINAISVNEANVIAATGTLTSGTFARGGLVSGPGPGGPVGGGSWASASSGSYTAKASVEHVPVPHRLPKRVLVAFLDEEGKPEPFWAAYLSLKGMNVVMNPDEPEDAMITLDLSLVKRFEQ